MFSMFNALHGGPDQLKVLLSLQQDYRLLPVRLREALNWSIIAVICSGPETVPVMVWSKIAVCPKSFRGSVAVFCFMWADRFSSVG